MGFIYVICFGDYYIEKPISSILKKQWLRFVDTFAVDIFMETLIMQSPEIYEVRKIGKSVLKIACQNQSIAWQNPWSDCWISLETCYALYLTFYFPKFPFDPPENIRKPKVFWCFLGDQKGTLRSKGLRIVTKFRF